RDGGADNTAIVSHTFWMEAFAGDRSAIGRAFTIDGMPFVLRGVLAPDFQFPRSDVSYYTKPIELMIPAASFPGFPQQSRQWFGIGRLAPGVSRLQAEAELQSVAEGLAKPTAQGVQWSVE